MKEQFDRILAEKIKNELLNHTEQYQTGAWENFLSRKKKRKNKILFWYFSGIAASLLVAISIGTLLVEDSVESYKPHNNLVKIIEPSPHTQPNKVVSEDSLIYQKQSEIDNLSAIMRLTDRHPNLPGSKKSQSIQNYSKAIFPLNATNGIADSMHSLNPILSILPTPDLIVSSIEITLEERNNPIFSANEIDISERKAPEKKTNTSIGLLFSPGYGMSEIDNQTVTITNLGGGISFDMPISSQMALNTGVIFNSLSMANKEVLTPTSQSDIIDQSSRMETNQVNMDIPINFRYSFPNKKENFYAMVGVSSYYTFNQRSELATTTIREIEIVQEVGNATEIITVTESLTDSQSFQDEANKFYPFGTINISAGFRAFISDNFVYEIQPFYKYPLISLTNNDVKSHLGGITLRITFLPKK